LTEEINRVERETTFGAWLRHRRRQMDLTQTELATRVGYSVVTIRKLERDELRPSKQLAERLAKSLDVAMGEQASVIAFARSGAAATSLVDIPPVQSSVRSHLPPQLTPFFGRTAELLALSHTLDDPDCRLLTLVGPGGIGKTRLALEIAQAQVPHTPHGVHFVYLAPLRSAEHIIPAIAEALDFHFQAEGRPPKEQLLDSLRHKQVLLLLDNFEHLRDGVDLIQELLLGCPTLRLLVTSRERLHLSSETVFTLDGMDLPTGTTLQEMLTYSAVQLFITTARRTRPKFALDTANAQDIVRICRLVGGMPLGIILAAAWVEVLSPAEIAAELSQGFAFLEVELRDLPDRHQSMRAVLAHSWQRLTAAEQGVFMRLAVFRGGFTRQAAQSVAGASLQTLSTLTNKSLVQRDATGRYTVHELLRQYAEGELAAAGQTADACAAHCAYYTGYLQQREADLKGHRQVAVLDEIEIDFENVRAGWQWAVAQRNYTAISNALKALWWFCFVRGYWYEGRSWLEQLLAISAAEASASIRAEATCGAGILALYQGDYTTAHTYLRESVMCFRAMGDKHGIADAQTFLCILAQWTGTDIHAIVDLEESIEFLREIGDQPRLAIALAVLGNWTHNVAALKESLSLYQRLGDRRGMTTALLNLGHEADDQGDYAQAVAFYVQSLALSREMGDRRGIAFAKRKLGEALQRQGNYAQAEIHYSESLALYQKLGHRRDLAWCLYRLGNVARHREDDTRAKQLYMESLVLFQELDLKRDIASVFEDQACFAAAQGQAERATRLLARAEVFEKAIGVQCQPDDSRDRACLIDSLRSQLEGSAFAQAWAEGETMTLPAAIAYLLSGI
jgi:predicted ATPase/DNA-binding XRE family transcriptional regulator